MVLQIHRLDSHSLEPKALEEEVDFILSTANRYLNKKVGKEDVLSIFAGLRPLAAPKDNSEKTKEISRSHKIIVSDSELNYHYWWQMDNLIEEWLKTL